MKQAIYANTNSESYKVWNAQIDRNKKVALSHALADENNTALTDEVGRKLTEEYK